MSPSKKVPWQSPSLFSFMLPVELPYHQVRPSLFTVLAPLASWLVPWQNLTAVHVSLLLTSIKLASPSLNLTVLPTTCFAFRRVQGQNRKKTISERQRRMPTSSWMFLVRKTGLMWCLSVLAPNRAFKWQFMYGFFHPHSFIGSTDVVIGTFIQIDGDRGWAGDAYRNGDSQYFPPTLGCSITRSGYHRLLPICTHIPRCTQPPRFPEVTKPG